MGVGFLILIFIAIVLLILSPLSYIVLKKFGYKKTGVVVALALAFIVIYPSILIIFESELYSKSDAKKDLEKLGFELENEFEIVSNEITGTSDYYQFTKLKISSKDKKKLIQEIQNSNDFKIIDSLEMSLQDSIYKFKLDETDSKVTFTKNYKLKRIFVKEYFEKQFDFVPTKMKIEIDELSDEIKLERIEDY